MCQPNQSSSLLPGLSADSAVADPFDAQPDTLLLQAPLVRDTAISRRTARFKLWELQDCWHCMIVGTCLTLREVKQAARKAGYAVDTLTHYEVHRLAVEKAADRRSRLTQRLQKVLETRFEAPIRRFRTATEATELETLWRLEWDAGKVAGPLWALLTHPHSTSDLIHRVYGEVHMLSHLAGASTLVDVGRVRSLSQRVEELERDVRDSQAKRRSAAERHERQLGEVRATLGGVMRDRAKLETDLARQRETAVGAATADAGDAQREHLLRQLRIENLMLREQVKARHEAEQRLVKSNERLERLLAQALSAGQPGHEDAPASDMCGRCVLFLGGKAPQCRHFQAMVEARQGTFLHHDGGIEDGSQRIAELVHQADAVLCPTDCISHSAMKKARLLCRKQEKPMIFLPRASMAAFADGLDELAAAC